MSIKQLTNKIRRELAKKQAQKQAETPPKGGWVQVRKKFKKKLDPRVFQIIRPQVTEASDG